jgi:hypothetical protein
MKSCLCELGKNPLTRVLHLHMIRFTRLPWPRSRGHRCAQCSMLWAMFSLLLSSRRYERTHDGLLRSVTLISPQGQVLQWHLHHTLHVPHLRLARSRLQAKPGRAPFNAPHEFAPHRVLIAAELYERIAHISVCTAPHSAVSAHRALDVAAAKDTLKSCALGQRRLRASKYVHLVKSNGYLLDAVIIRPSF